MGVVARAKQSRDGDGDEKGGEACGRDACGGIGGGTWVHAIMANVEGPLYLAVSQPTGDRIDLVNLKLRLNRLKKISGGFASKEATSLDASVSVQKVATRGARNDSTKERHPRDTPPFLRGAIGEVDRSRDVGSVGGGTPRGWCPSRIPSRARHSRRSLDSRLLVGLANRAD